MNKPSVNLNTPEFLFDPYPFYRQLREAGAPVWLPHNAPSGGMWLFTRYDDVLFILKDTHTFKDDRARTPPEGLTPLSEAMLDRDPPDHTRLRRLANQAFTPQRVKDLEPRIAQVSQELVERIRVRGEADFIADFALPLPVIVIAELLGVPAADHDRFGVWSNRVMASGDAVVGTEESLQQGMEAMVALAGYLAELIRQRRQQPREDLISALVTARDAGDRLSEEELLGTCVLLLIAGHETTVNLLGNGLLTLLRHPEQLALLKEHPESIPSAVEEMLRYESPIQRATPRFAAQPFELAGQRIEQGQQVSAVIGAANRDPAHFPDPDRFDITRNPNRHLSFGHGIHFCLGAPLARVEARIAFGQILESLPDIRLATEQPEWRPATWFRGLKRLPVVV
jgi:cytochrome P450